MQQLYRGNHNNSDRLLSWGMVAGCKLLKTDICRHILIFFSSEYVVTSLCCNNFIYLFIVNWSRAFILGNETKKPFMDLLLFAFDKVQICCFQYDTIAIILCK